MTGFLTRVSTRKSLFMTTSLPSSWECWSGGCGGCGGNGFSIRAQEKFSQILMPQVVNRSRKDLLDHVAPFFCSRRTSFIVFGCDVTPTSTNFSFLAPAGSGGSLSLLGACFSNVNFYTSLSRWKFCVWTLFFGCWCCKYSRNIIAALMLEAGTSLPAIDYLFGTLSFQRSWLESYLQKHDQTRFQPLIIDCTTRLQSFHGRARLFSISCKCSALIDNQPYLAENFTTRFRHQARMPIINRWCPINGSNVLYVLLARIFMRGLWVLRCFTMHTSFCKAHNAAFCKLE